MNDFTNPSFCEETYANGSKTYIACINRKTKWFFNLFTETQTFWVLPSRSGYQLSTLTSLTFDFAARFPSLEEARTGLESALMGARQMEGMKVVSIKKVNQPD